MTKKVGSWTRRVNWVTTPRRSAIDRKRRHRETANPLGIGNVTSYSSPVPRDSTENNTQDGTRRGLSGKSAVLLECGLERRHKLAAQLLWPLGLINETTAIALNKGYKSRHLRFSPLTSGEQIMILKKIVHFLLVLSFHYYYYSVTQFERLPCRLLVLGNRLTISTRRLRSEISHFDSHFLLLLPSSSSSLPTTLLQFITRRLLGLSECTPHAHLKIV